MKTLPIIPATALAALILTMGAGGWQSVRLAREHAALKVELEGLRGTPDAPQASDRPKRDSLIAQTQAELERESAQLSAVQAKVAEAEKALPPLKGEELRSLGRIEELGKSAGQFIEQMIHFATRMSAPEGKKLSGEEQNKMMEEVMPWLEKVDMIGGMEDDPQEIARLHAATIAERLKLDTATAARMKDQITREFTDLVAAGLVRSKRPEGDGVEEWQKRRSAAVKDATGRVEALIPAGARQPWVVEQSMQLGVSLQKQVTVGADGHGSMNLGIALPGMQGQKF
jgi:hypothetical protein